MISRQPVTSPCKNYPQRDQSFFEDNPTEGKWELGKRNVDANCVLRRLPGTLPGNERKCNEGRGGLTGAMGWGKKDPLGRYLEPSQDYCLPPPYASILPGALQRSNKGPIFNLTESEQIHISGWKSYAPFKTLLPAFLKGLRPYQKRHAGALKVEPSFKFALEEFFPGPGAGCNLHLLHFMQKAYRHQSKF